MYLIDTSVWIAFLRNEKQKKCVQEFNKILDSGISYGISSVIYQEILQGASSTKDFNYLAHYLGTQKFYYPKDKILTYQAAAEIYFQCRKKGITIRSTIDCLIAQIAIEHGLTLLHHDKDYLKISKIVPDLQLFDN